jgi:hypothetical protein
MSASQLENDELFDRETESTSTATAWSKKPRVRGIFGKSKVISSIRKQPTLHREESVLREDPGVSCQLEASFSTPSFSDLLACHSEESIENQNALNLRMTRRNSMTAIPPKPARRAFTRSYSLNVSSSALGSTASNTSSSASFNDDISPLGEWGAEPLVDVEAELGRDRKKSRNVHGHGSIKDSLAPLVSSCFSQLARSAEDWKRIDEPKVFDGEVFEQSSPGGRSVASSRKRGVDGSPLFSDLDDMSVSMNSGSARHTRSRSRIFSPVKSSNAFSPLGYAGRYSPEELGRPAMDIDSDDEASDDSSRDNYSNETSFDGSPRTSLKDSPESRLVETEADVLETMSSYEDLKFLIGALRKERKKPQLNFIAHDSWMVTPKQQWPGIRRAAFFKWATRDLGFSVRAAGGSVNYLQITKIMGTDVLTRLEKALILYKHDEQEQKENELPDSNLFKSESPTFMEASYGSRKTPAIAEGIPDDDFASSLVAGMQVLAVKETTLAYFDNSLASRSSLESHVVTNNIMMAHLHSPLAQTARTSIIGSELASRASLASTASGCTLPSNRLSGPFVKAARSSLESHADTNDMMMHLHGHSPRVGTARPSIARRDLIPRASLGSTASGCTLQSNRLSGILAAAPSFEILET